VTHDARLLFNIARVLDKQGKEPEALTYYRQFLAAPVSDEEQKTKARGYVEQLEDKAMLRQESAARALSAMTRKTLPAPTSNGEGNVAPVYKRGGFWGVVIGGAAVVGLGVRIGSRPKQPRTDGTGRNEYGRADILTEAEPGLQIERRDYV
jgi:hypothetical protein